MNQYAVTIILKKEYSDGGGTSQLGVEIPTRFLFISAVIAIFLMIIALVLKLLFNRDEDERGLADEGRPTESTGLLFSKEEVTFSWYGSSDDDLEWGKESCSSSSEDLYDGRICVICYDHQRNCLFAPCGHCVTCDTCAKRIVSEDIKICPICRTPINKVRMLQIL